MRGRQCAQLPLLQGGGGSNGVCRYAGSHQIPVLHFSLNLHTNFRLANIRIARHTQQSTTHSKQALKA